MATIQVDGEVKRLLFTLAAELQQRSGRKVSLSEAIGHLLEAHWKSQRDKEGFLSLFGCLRGEREKAQSLLSSLRLKEERRLEVLTRKRHL